MTRSIAGYTLALEASTYAGSVAVLSSNEVVSSSDVEMRGRDQERLMPAVAECVGRLPEGMAAIQRVVCGAGPGSFTSLRIAASIAKGICHARGIPLFAVSSLALVIASAGKERGRYLVALDAMRGESFAALIDVAEDGTIPVAVPIRIVSRTALAEEAARAGAEVVDGAPHVAGVARMLDSIVSSGPVDLAAWEPDYGRAAEAQVKWEAAHGRPLPK
ncbi:MAG: tRNA (adenosine(37)-N6)-threonylcarbamoyltransferase complex dimerization subunit type 1 TsaB [Gemmatimonadaceae bacterium]|nr:tRNA (adenosine(37)-N6)-threonylcarbamoyltransferase complex dimerization subunit type 1 TsaB [Gemmatimonadaceae bacterium]